VREKTRPRYTRAVLLLEERDHGYRTNSIGEQLVINYGANWNPKR
jgi:hypothetical protein